MLISFFEEFPTPANIKKLKLLNFKTKLYIAAKNLNDFNNIQSTMKSKNVGEIIYWPILEGKEGYWISPFAKRSALKRIFNELKGTRTAVMLDLELTRNPNLYVTQFFNFLRNKSLIKSFIKTHGGKVYLAEYYPEGKRKERILAFLGLHYKTNAVHIIKMVYHSMHNFDKKFITNELQAGKKEFGNKYLVAYGTIAKGIDGWEPILPTLQLDKDLEIAKQTGIPEVVIFRLGGLNRKYLKVIKKFV